MVIQPQQLTQQLYPHLIAVLLVLGVGQALLIMPSELVWQSGITMVVLASLWLLTGLGRWTLSPTYQRIHAIGVGFCLAVHQWLMIDAGSFSAMMLYLSDLLLILTVSLTLFSTPLLGRLVLAPLLLPLTFQLQQTPITSEHSAALMTLSLAVVTSTFGQRLLLKLNRFTNLQHQHYRQLKLLLSQTTQQDGLTGIANRSRFDQRLHQVVAENRRTKNPLTLVMLNVDYFRSYNEHYGHQEGDRCLKGLAKLILHCSRRQTDIIARYGGEEFAILLPVTDKTGAERLLRQLRNELSQASLTHAHSPISDHVTLSAGVAQWKPGQNAQSLVEQAKNALASAKLEGRNRYFIA